MNRLTAGLILTVGVCGILGLADHLLTQEIQQLEENLGLYQEGDYPLGVRIEVEGSDVEADSDEPETTGSEI